MQICSFRGFTSRVCILWVQKRFYLEGASKLDPNRWTWHQKNALAYKEVVKRGVREWISVKMHISVWIFYVYTYMNVYVRMYLRARVAAKFSRRRRKVYNEFVVLVFARYSSHRKFNQPRWKMERRMSEKFESSVQRNCLPTLRLALFIYTHKPKYTWIYCSVGENLGFPIK